SAYQTLQEICADIGKKRAMQVNWKLLQETAPVACDNVLSGLLAQAIQDNSYDVIRLVSGAGHDGVAISEVAPIAMLFVRCFRGISHNPLENDELTDMAATLQVADTFMNKLVTNFLSC